MTNKELSQKLSASPKKWFVTGAAGFIGSHLVEFLLKSGQEVVGIDNFSNSSQESLAEIKNANPNLNWNRFQFHKMDVCDQSGLFETIKGCDYVLHQAAVGSVPRSILDPISTHDSNVTGTLQVLYVAEKLKIKNVVYASSSSVYGDNKTYPQREDQIGAPLSPYAVSKRVCEIYAANFTAVYNLPTIGLRYFNVFGPRQRPDGPYAAVIPKWISAILKNQQTEINGDGTTSRDFCFVKNVVNANILAALNTDPALNGQIFNIALGGSTSLNELHQIIAELISKQTNREIPQPKYGPFRRGDIKLSCADIGKAKQLLKFTPEFSVKDGLIEAVEHYVKKN